MIISQNKIYLLHISLLMSPEFFNPLFLKIYCKSLKSIGKNKFQIGSKRIRKVFEFYIDTISKNINDKKRYGVSEEIVLEALRSFALELFPNKISGIPIGEARNLIQLKDINKNNWRGFI